MIDDTPELTCDEDDPGLERLDALLADKDEFRLVIRGFAGVDELLGQAISNAFGDQLPRELRDLRLPARLALAKAVGAVSPELAAAIQAFAKIRHRLAHGAEPLPDDACCVSDEEALGLWRLIRSELQDLDPHDYSPWDQLRLAIAAIWIAVDDSVDDAHWRRRETEDALAAYRKRQRVLSFAQAAELLQTSTIDEKPDD
jgi:hypothetical protein